MTDTDHTDRIHALADALSAKISAANLGPEETVAVVLSALEVEIAPDWLQCGSLLILETKAGFENMLACVGAEARPFADSNVVPFTPTTQLSGGPNDAAQAEFAFDFRLFDQHHWRMTSATQPSTGSKQRAPQMIFYHCTLIANLGSVDGSDPGIMRDGLLPHEWKEHFAHLPKKVVWLTTQAEGVPSWWRNQDPEGLKAYCRITVAIPTSDRRLMQFEELYRSLGCILPATCPAGFDPEVFRIIRWNQVWVYVGKVGLNRFRLVRFADPTMHAETMKEFADHHVAGISDASPPQTCG